MRRLGILAVLCSAAIAEAQTTPAAAAPRRDSLALLLEEAERAVRQGRFKSEDWDYARGLARRALAMAGERQDVRAQLDATALIAWTFDLADANDSALVYRQRQHALAARLGDSLSIHRGNVAVAVAFSDAGNADLAAMMLEQLAERYRAAGQRAFEASALINLASVLDTAALDRALPYARQALSIMRELPDTSELSDVAAVVHYYASLSATRALARLDTAAAIALLRESAEAQRGLWGEWRAWEADTALATLYERRGLADSAIAVLRVALDGMLEAKFTSYLEAVLPRLIALEEGRAPADTLIRRLRLLASVQRGTPAAAAAYEKVASLYRDAGNVDSAKAFLVETAVAELELGRSERQWHIYQELVSLHTGSPAARDSARMYARLAFVAFKDLMFDEDAVARLSSDSVPGGPALRSCVEWSTMLANFWVLHREPADSNQRIMALGLAEALEHMPDSVRSALGAGLIRPIEEIDMRQVRQHALKTAADLSTAEGDYWDRYATMQRQRLAGGAPATRSRPQPWGDALRRQIQCVAFDLESPALSIDVIDVDSTTPPANQLTGRRPAGTPPSSPDWRTRDASEQ